LGKRIRALFYVFRFKIVDNRAKGLSCVSASVQITVFAVALSTLNPDWCLFPLLFDFREVRWSHNFGREGDNHIPAISPFLNKRIGAPVCVCTSFPCVISPTCSWHFSTLARAG
jgi:hypothetical protein